MVYWARGIPGCSVVKNLPAKQEMQVTQVQSLSWEDPMEKEMATHSNILDWEIPWTEEPGGLHPWGHKELGHSLVTKQQCWTSIELGIELGKRNKIHACKLAHMTEVTLHINKERKQYSINGASKVFIFIIYTFLLEYSCLTMLCAPKYYIA